MGNCGDRSGLNQNEGEQQRRQHSQQQKRHSLQCWMTEWKERRELPRVKRRTALVLPKDISLTCVCCLSEGTEQADCEDITRFRIVTYAYMCMTAVKAWNTPSLISLSKCFCFSLWGKQYIPKHFVDVPGGSAASAVQQAAPRPQGRNALRRVDCRGKGVTKTQVQPSDGITALFQSILQDISSSHVFWPQL